MRASRRLIMAGFFAAAATAVEMPANAEPNRVNFPDVEALEHYTTVTRGSTVEHMLTSREAIEAVKTGKPIPDGTHFVLVHYLDGKLYRYFVMEKGEGWGADYDDERRTGDWQFQWFWPDKSINLSENTARCQSCHSSQSESEYLFTGYRIPRFNGAPVE